MAVGVAYLIALQALVASIGLGMSPVSGSGSDEFQICSLIASDNLVSRNDHRRSPGNQAQCLFCLAAAQTAGHPALIGSASTSPAYAEVKADAMRQVFDDGPSPASAFRRTTGDPRGPPGFFI